MTTAAETADKKAGNAGDKPAYAEQTGQKPSPCRIVLYNHTADTIGHHMGLDGKLKINQSPAMVMFVNPDGTLRLSVFQQFGGANKIADKAEQYVALQGADTDPPPPNGPPGTWQWPPRV